jgi:hypothetical protein
MNQQPVQQHAMLHAMVQENTHGLTDHNTPCATTLYYLYSKTVSVQTCSASTATAEAAQHRHLHVLYTLIITQHNNATSTYCTKQNAFPDSRLCYYLPACMKQLIVTMFCITPLLITPLLLHAYAVTSTQQQQH